MGGPTKHPYVSWHPLADHEKLDVALVPDPRKDGRSPVVLEAVRMLSGGRVPVLCAVTAPFTLTCMLRGERETMMDLIVDPTYIHNVMALAEKFSLSFVEAAVEEGADVIVIEDTWASGEILSMQQYEEFALPGERTLTSKVRELGASSILQQCGHPMLNLPLMARCGTNGILVHQMVDLKEARGKLGDDIALVGNIDPENMVLQPPERIMELSMKCMSDGIDVLSPACGLDPTASLRNLQAMAEAAKSFRPGEG
ncbi:MAG: Methylcobamide:CoM methyltransferase MtbA [Methanomassiliicoccales archaeon PtaB.Bin215]|nr:MAG: Methylcobamide:CoM methyltransferase MtbA [Methanomassiliicoccales archaeon PtaB.Bin215]